jgi:hypothetical protein
MVASTITVKGLIEGHIMAGPLDRLVKVDTNNNIRKSHRAALLLESVKLSFSKDGQKLILLDNQVLLSSINTHVKGNVGNFCPGYAERQTAVSVMLSLCSIWNGRKPVIKFRLIQRHWHHGGFCLTTLAVYGQRGRMEVGHRGIWLGIGEYVELHSHVRNTYIAPT